MSYNEPKLNVVKIQDPRISTVLNDSKKRYCLLEGGQEYSQKVIPNQGTASFTNLNWTAPPSSPQTVIDPLILVSYPVQVDFVGTSVSGNLLGGGTDGNLNNYLGPNDSFRSFPISSLINTLTAKINGQQVSYNLRDYIHTIEHMHNTGVDSANDNSLYPSQRDPYQDYGDYNIYGGNRSPFVQYGENPYVPSRGSFPIQILSNTPTSASIRALITEPLILSPFYFGKGVSPYGMVGIQSLEFQINFDSNLGRIWSHANTVTGVSTGHVLTSVTPSFYGNCNLLMTQIKLKDYMVIPRSLELPYFFINNYPSAVYSLAKGASVTVQLQNVQMSSVPEKFLIWARQQNSDQTFATTETFAQFNNLNLQFDVKSGLFASATSEQLWRMSRDNGSDQTYHDWLKFQGGIMVGMFGKDVGLDSQTVPGRLGTWNFQPTVTITNISTQVGTINFQIFETLISEGVATIKDNTMMLKQGVMSHDDIKHAVADNSPYVDYSLVTQVYGGDFLSSLKSVFYKALPYIKKYGIPVARALLGAGGKKKARKSKAGILDGYDHMAYAGGAGSGGAYAGAAMSGGKKKARKSKAKAAKKPKAKKSKAKKSSGGAKKMVRNKMMSKIFGSGLVDNRYMEQLIKKYE